MNIGDRVFIIDNSHPWAGCAGTVVAVDQTYGLGWKGDRVKLDGNGGETFVRADQVNSGKPRIDKMTVTYRRRQVRART